GDGEKYEIMVSPAPSGIQLDLAVGRNVSAEGTMGIADYEAPLGEILVPVSYVEPLGFASAEDAVGEVLTIALSDPFGNQHEVNAYVAGVMRRGLFGEAFVTSSALRDEMFAAHTRGLPPIVANVFQSA